MNLLLNLTCFYLNELLQFEQEFKSFHLSRNYLVFIQGIFFFGCCYVLAVGSLGRQSLQERMINVFTKQHISPSQTFIRENKLALYGTRTIKKSTSPNRMSNSLPYTKCRKITVVNWIAVIPLKIAAVCRKNRFGLTWMS